MKNRICDLLGIEYPILAFSHCRDVVAAVTNAGGFGVLGAVSHTPEALEIDLAWIDDQVAGRPYGVDLLLPSAHARVGAGDRAADPLTLIPEEYRRFLDGLLDRYGVEPLPDDEAAPRRTLSVSVDDNATLLDIALGHRVELLASALGPPPPAFVERAHDAGAVVAALAGTVEHARRHAAAGVDVVVAQGTEAGGHTGEIATMVLVPEVVDAVAPVPVLAAGGIASGRQMAAAFALGAEGVWCGSVWLTTEEAETHPAVKQKFLAAAATDTVRSRSLTGKPARQLRSAWTDAWADPANPEPLPMPLQTLLIGEAQRRINRQAHQPGSGAAELANYFVGQVVGSLDRVRPARQVVQAMVAEFVDVVDELGHVFDDDLDRGSV